MTKTAFTLFVSDQTWRIGLAADEPAVLDVPPSEASDPASQAKAAAALLREKGYSGEGLIVAVPSAWSLCASIPTDGLPRRNRREAMLFRLEEKLPAAAEDMVADFVVHPNHALGVCLLLEKIELLVTELETAGIAVEAICPASLLALQEFLSTGRNQEPCAFLWGHEGQVELFFLSQGRPVAWFLVADDLEALKVPIALRLLKTTGPLRALAVGLGESLARELADMADIELTLGPSLSLPVAATSAAKALGHGHRQAWVNLRRDRLAVKDPARQIRRPLQVAFLAAAVFLASLAAATFYRAQSYRRMALKADARAMDIFRETIPNQPAPMDIRPRMESEARKVQAVSGQGSQIPRQPSALLVLREALRRLPDDVRFRLLDIRVQGEGLTLEGATRSHALADRLAGSLRTQNGFTVEPPRTKARADGGVDFTLRASVPAANPSPEKRP